MCRSEGGRAKVRKGELYKAAQAQDEESAGVRFWFFSKKKGEGVSIPNILSFTLEKQAQEISRLSS